MVFLFVLGVFATLGSLITVGIGVAGFVESELSDRIAAALVAGGMVGTCFFVQCLVWVAQAAGWK